MVLTRLPAQRESIHNHSALQWSKLHPPKMGLCRSHSRDCPRCVLLWLLSHSKPGIRCKLFLTLFFIRMHKPQTEPQYFASAAWFHAPSVPRVMQLSPAAAALPPALSSMQPVWEAKQPSEPLGTYSPSEINLKKKKCNFFYLPLYGLLSRKPPCLWPVLWCHILACSSHHWIFPSSRCAGLRLAHTSIHIHAHHCVVAQRGENITAWWLLISLWWIRGWGKLAKEQCGLRTIVFRQFIRDICTQRKSHSSSGILRQFEKM